MLAVNLAVFTAVQGGLTCWIKKMNKFTEIETGMMAMFGAGAALSVSSSLSGQKAAFGGRTAIPEGPVQIAQEALKSGVLFSLLNGAFMKIGQKFSGKNEKTDVFYSHAVGMLTTLGLEKYEKNFKRGLLTDDCLLLLNDNALQEVRDSAWTEVEDFELCGGDARGAATATATGHEFGRETIKKIVSIVKN